ncbi:hypothetical protein HanLR1_Chr15g0577951 [Helianthus annuus]|nr:hypothetical protein HanHA89_Chr15g0616811 [Helianthus annuus]KAJ0648892.1 hypothetical protein HanLR1_Chr15g0577951 [Helianthus annuus]
MNHCDLKCEYINDTGSTVRYVSRTLATEFSVNCGGVGFCELLICFFDDLS